MISGKGNDCEKSLERKRNTENEKRSEKRGDGGGGMSWME